MWLRKISSRPPTFPSHSYSSETSRLVLNLDTASFVENRFVHLNKYQWQQIAHCLWNSRKSFYMSTKRVYSRIAFSLLIQLFRLLAIFMACIWTMKKIEVAKEKIEVASRECVLLRRQLTMQTRYPSLLGRQGLGVRNRVQLNLRKWTQVVLQRLTL